MQKISEKGLTLIKNFEGLRLEAYLCPSGVWTIGYGHTKGVKKGHKCTKEQASHYLRADVAWAEVAVRHLVKVPLNQNQFDALVSFVFNIGTGAFAKSTLLRVLNSGNYSGVPGQIRRYNKGGSPLKVLPGLVKRRDAEAKLWSSNE